MASTGTGVVVGSHSLKVVQVRRKRGVPALARVASVKLDPALADRPFDARKADHVRDILATLGVKAGATLLGLTGRDLIIRYTHVPPVPDWRLDMLMKFEIDEVSEQSGGEVSADWARLEIDETVSGENTILVALAKNAALLPRMKMLEKAGIRIRGACPNSLGMFHAFRTAAKIPPGEVTLLMHVGAENTDIAIQRDGKLLFARNVAGGGRLFTEAIMQQFGVKYDRAEKMKLQKADVSPRSSAKYEDSMAEKVSHAVLGVTGQFVSMVHSSVMFCKAQTKLKELGVDRVVLAGGGANLKGFSDYLSQNLGIPVEVFDPLKALDASALPPAEAQAADAEGTGLATALGLALLATEDAFKLQILPEEYRKRRKLVERDLWMILAAAATVLLIAVLFTTTSRDHQAALTTLRSARQRQTTYRGYETNYQQAKAEAGKWQKKYAALRDVLRVNPCLTRAAGLVDRVIVSGGFTPITVTKMETDVRKENAPPKAGAAGESPVPGQPPDKIEIVTVRFHAEIQELGISPNKVYADFLRALTTEVRKIPASQVENGALQGRTTRGFDFAISFPPEKE